MSKIPFYFAITLLAFVVGSVVVFVSYFKTDINAISVEEPAGINQNWVKKTIRKIESKNKGFDELLNFNNGDTVTVQGFFDAKFLCYDVTFSQPNICTTVLIGGSEEKKSLLIRLPVCSERDKSDCIVWKPDNLCSNGKYCSHTIRVYDNNSEPIDLSNIETSQLKDEGKSYYRSNIKIKLTGKISIIEGKYYLKNPVEKIELIDLE